MATVHLLTQYVWPDAAPTGLYAEQLAARIVEQGNKVKLIGGRGGYRALPRAQPVAEIVHLDHYQGRRGNLRQTFVEYASVTRAFRDYIGRFVRHDDLVIVTSAPPNTVTLASTIHRRGARCVYWLQDYYPELVRGLYDYPGALRRAFRRFWDHHLARWDKVVKIGANLGGPTRKSVVIRNWPTLSFDTPAAPEPRTAIYSGNLGYGHDVKLLVDACARLRSGGYRITMRADGRGVARLPAWLSPLPLESDPEKLRHDLLRHEVHLVAANPKIRQAIFPSKIWNSIAAGRELICTGFAGEMAEELEASKNAPFETHLNQWSQLIAETQNCERPRQVRTMEAALA
jgi:colanic acid biosynthesis glycosyl transferase WcaI